jgi:hypothetical protein
VSDVLVALDEFESFDEFGAFDELSDELEALDELAAPVEPSDEFEAPSSAAASPGVFAIEAPMPSATASAPTLQMKRPYVLGVVATAGVLPRIPLRSADRLTAHSLRAR